jgi:integrase
MQLRPFTFAGFEMLWKGEEVAGTLKELANEKKLTVNRHSSQIKYDQLLTKVAEFDSRELLPHDITFFWLQRFEKFLQGQKLSRARIIFYMRYLKAVLNYAVDKGVMDEKFIPFGRSGNKYTVGVPPKTIEKTLTKSEIRKLFAYEAEPGSEKHFALCIFRLSFYLSGANMADLFRLTKENIHGDRIVFIRRKTSDTSRTGRKVIANYTSVVQELFKALHKPGSHYLLPGLEEGMTEEQQMKRVNHRTQVINRNLKEIAKELKLGKSITTGYARHSFATVLRDEGYTDDQIANLMGNSKSVVEKNYFGAADEKKVNQIFNSLNLEEGGRASDE